MNLSASALGMPNHANLLFKKQINSLLGFMALWQWTFLRKDKVKSLWKYWVLNQEVTYVRRKMWWIEENAFPFSSYFVYLMQKEDEQGGSFMTSKSFPMLQYSGTE